MCDSIIQQFNLWKIVPRMFDFTIILIFKSTVFKLYKKNNGMTTNYYQYAVYLHIKTKPQVENMVIKIKNKTFMTVCTKI